METGGTVCVYSCGPTIYRPVHIGNMRAYVFADTLNRAFRHFGTRVRHVINLTDVGHLSDDADAGEDKIEKQARRENIRIEELVSKNAALFFSDLAALNIPKRRYRFPRATDHIPEQIAIIRTLEQKGLTYSVPDGIYFDTGAYPHYGAFGLPTRDEETSRARIEPIAGKKRPNDFALWKRTPPGVTRQQEWDSPWGRGFPGWHIECSAMAMRLLGETIDIHTGGVDHISVHHNNEIAQSECATGKTFAHVWMHAEFLTVDHEKMSKSEGNTHTLNDIGDMGYDPLALRYLFLQSSYRTHLSFSFTSLTAAQTALHRLRREYAMLPKSLFGGKPHAPAAENIDSAIADDLNTAKVIATVWNVINDGTIPAAVKRNTVRYADRVLGILPAHSFIPPRRGNKKAEIPEEIRNLARERDAARTEKNFQKADELRDTITRAGYEVSDGEHGTVITRTTHDRTNER